MSQGYRVAKHDGTEFFVLNFSEEQVTYYPVPGGVVMKLAPVEIVAPTSVFVPMVRLLFEVLDDGSIANVRLESTMAQLMTGAALAGMAAAMNSPEGHDG